MTELHGVASARNKTLMRTAIRKARRVTVGVVAFTCVAQAPALAKTTVMVNAIGPASSSLYVAKADGSGERLLLADPKFEYDASFSSDGKWIVFTSERNGPANIYRVRIDGSGLEQLTHHNGFDDQGALSPDGRTLAFVSTRKGGVANIWLEDLKSGKLRNLTGGLPVSPGKLHSYLRPSWSPDGQWLAFSSDRNTQLERHEIPAPGWEHLQRSSIYILRLDGTGLRRLSDGHEAAGSPKWSSDGRRVVFYALAPEQTFAARTVGMALEGQGNAKIDTQLVSVGVDGGQRRVLRAIPGFDVSPQFVGKDRVGYLRKGADVLEGRLAYSDAGSDTESAVGPAPGDMRNPAWSSEGVLVVYQKYGYGLKQGQPLYSPDPNLQLRFSGEFPAVSAQGKVAFTPFPHEKGQSPNVPVDVANPDGTDRHTVYQSAGAAMGVTWSPDGQQMVVSQGVMVLNSPLQLALINVADGAVIRTLTDKSVSAAFPSFAPDGKHVVYRVKGKDQTGLRILDLDDGQTRALTTGHDNFPFWSPDGSRICFTRDVGGVQAFDIFTVRPDGSELRHLVNAPGNDAHCGWIRDSRKIIFSSSRLGYRDEAPLYDRALAQPYSELFVMNVDGSNQHPITDDKWEQGTPAVVP